VKNDVYKNGYRRRNRTSKTAKIYHFVRFVMHCFILLSTKPNSIKIGVSVGVADIINPTKFGNDRSREYKVTEGRILACSIGMACRL